MNNLVPLHTCLGTFRYEGGNAGVVWQPLDSGNPNFIVYLLIPKTDIVDAALEAQQAEHFGSHISHVPQLVLDLRLSVLLPRSTVLVPIYVVHLRAFLNKSIVYRTGMDDIYAIQCSWPADSFSPVLLEAQEEAFPLYSFSGLHHCLPGSRSELALAVNLEHSWYMFRNAIASRFTTALTKKKAHETRIHFNLLVSQENIRRFYSAECFEIPVYKDDCDRSTMVEHQGGREVRSHLVHDNDQLRRVREMKETLSLEVYSASALSWFIGTECLKYPEVWDNRQPVAELSEVRRYKMAEDILFKYDILEGELLVSASVKQVSRDVARSSSDVDTRVAEWNTCLVYNMKIFDIEANEELVVVLVENNHTCLKSIPSKKGKRGQRIAALVVWMLPDGRREDDQDDHPVSLGMCRSNAEYREHYCEMYSPEDIDVVNQTIPHGDIHVRPESTLSSLEPMKKRNRLLVSDNNALVTWMLHRIADNIQTTPCVRYLIGQLSCSNQLDSFSAIQYTLNFYSVPVILQDFESDLGFVFNGYRDVPKAAFLSSFIPEFLTYVTAASAAA